MWAPKSRPRKSPFCWEGGPQDDVGQETQDVLSTGHSPLNGKKCESNGKMTETTRHIYGEAIGKSYESIAAICPNGKYHYERKYRAGSACC